MEFSYPDPLTLSSSMSRSLSSTMYSPHKLDTEISHLSPRAKPKVIMSKVPSAQTLMAEHPPFAKPTIVKSEVNNPQIPVADPQRKKEPATVQVGKCQRKSWKKSIANFSTTLFYITLALVALLAWIRFELHRESSMYEPIPPPDVEKQGMCRRAVRDHSRDIDWPMARLYLVGVMSTPDSWCQKYHDISVEPLTPAVKRAAEKIVCEELEKKMDKHHVGVEVIQEVFRGGYDGLLPKIDEMEDYWFQNETLKLILYAAFAKHEGYQCKRYLGPVPQTEL